MKRLICAVILCCGATAASAHPFVLDPAQLDGVSAGGGSSAVAIAGATGSLIAYTNTAGLSIIYKFGSGPAGSTVGVAGAVAEAVAAGAGASMGVYTGANNSVPGTVVASFTINHYAASNIATISTTTTLTVGVNGKM